MKRTVRLQRGLYVLLDSYRHPALRLSPAFLFCLKYIEQQQLLCPTAQRAQ
jgi:hypothetical protein